MNKETLAQLYYLHREIELLEERIARLQSQVERMTSVLTGMPRGNRANELLEELIDLKDTLSQRKQKCLADTIQIEKYINQIDDSFLRAIFSMRHGEGLSWNKIAHQIGNNTADSVRMAHDRYLKQAQ